MTPHPRVESKEARDVRRVAILGAGLAGARAAEELRGLGYDGRLVLIGAEPHLPYDRPPLSKSVLVGETGAAATAVHPAQWYADHGVELRLGAVRVDLDPVARQVVLPGEAILYDRLLVSTGARPRRFAPVEGVGAEVIYLRTLEDAAALRSRLDQRLLVVGAGWIGLEVAAAASRAGGSVTVVETAELPLVGVLGPEVAGVFADLHRQHGVDLRVGTTVTGARAMDDRVSVGLSDGSAVGVDAIVVGIGAEPNVGTARSAGLAVDRGILVDAELRTSAPGIFAAGDVASHDHPTLGRLRVEHWDNAAEQGRHAARNLLGAGEAYRRLPYFFSDQYDLGMEYLGHVGPAGYDEVRIDGDPQGRVFTAWWVRSGVVVAGMHAGDWDAMDRIRQHVGGPASRLSG